MFSLKEEWLPVVGYEGAYEVSSEGRVRSLDRTDAGGRKLQGKMLALAKTSGDKLVVTLYDTEGDIGRKQHHVAWLVLEAFGEPRPEGKICLHWDDDPANNRLDNLRWGDKSENTLDAVRNGKNFSSSKTHCPRNHPFTEWNNRADNKRKGTRACLSCARAYGRLYRKGERKPGKHPERGRIADEIFEQLKEKNE